MNAMKTLVRLSQMDFTLVLPGELFSFEGYTNVRISMTRATAKSTALQPHSAIYGLYKLIYQIAKASSFVDSTMTLYWTENGVKSIVGYIQIVPWPFPGTVPSNKTQAIGDLTQRSIIESRYPTLSDVTVLSTTNVSGASNAPAFNLPAKLQGTFLPIPDVFITLCLTLMVMSHYPSTSEVIAFETDEANANSRLIFSFPDRPPSSPPFLTYQYACRALGRLAKYFFQQGTFEDVLFVIKLDKGPLGIGELRKGRIRPPETLVNCKKP